MGGVVDSIGGLLGGQEAGFKTNKGALYQPYNYKSITGTTELQKDGNEYTFSQELSPELAALYGASLGAAQPAFESYMAATQAQLPQFGFSADPRAREAEIFQQQAALLQPELLRQQTQARDVMFGSGRLGLQLSGDTTGAGGMTNPDAYQLGLAQSRAIAELAPQARQMAQAEQQQAFDQARNIFDINQMQKQQQLQNLYSGYMGAMGGVRNVFDIERQLVGDAASREQAIRMAAAGASMPVQGSSGALGSILAGAAANPSLFASGSDIRLKQDLVSLGKVNGHKMYSWNWTKEAINMGFGEQGTIGVLAQEVLEYMPEAVAMFDDGYYRVNYDMLYGSTFNNAGES